MKVYVVKSEYEAYVDYYDYGENLESICLTKESAEKEVNRLHNDYISNLEKYCIRFHIEEDSGFLQIIKDSDGAFSDWFSSIKYFYKEMEAIE